VPRCAWALDGQDATLLVYHDTEWGRPVRGDPALYERLSLEGFQAGLSWRTVLHKRERLRHVFHGFDPAAVAGLTSDDIDTALRDPGIIRHRGKVEAVIANARALLRWQDEDGDGCLDRLLWAAASPTPRAQPRALADVPAQTPASVTLAKRLRHRGFRFVGPTTVYASLQAVGIVDDHLAGCRRRP
jgi:DNA-3-methyladenine glycosylase I